jgi:hypothetical protein
MDATVDLRQRFLVASGGQLLKVPAAHGGDLGGPSSRSHKEGREFDPAQAADTVLVTAFV